jgi:membrane protease YdiL (CAAX protease family)
MTNNIYAYLIITAAFVILMLSEIRAFRQNSRNLEDVLSGKGSMNMLIARHLVNAIVLGIAVACSVILLNHNGIGLLPGSDITWLLIGALAALAAFLSGFFAAKGKQLLSVAIANYSLVNTYFFVRALFLIVYEFFFRGVLLQALLGVVNMEWAIAINIILYAIAHAFSNKKELIGSIPFGLLLCLVTIKLQSVWPAIIIHLALSFSYETRISYLYSRLIKRVNV